MTQHLPALQKEWEALLANNKWSPLFAGMQQHLNSHSEAGKTLLQLRSRHSKVYTEEMLGTVSNTDANLEYNRIRKSLLDLLGLLTPEDLGADNPAEDPLDALVRALRVEMPLSTPLFLVNCNRRPEWRFFRRSFSTRQQECCRFQFYFILACPTQEPEGFAERVVYELLGEHADTHHLSIRYRRRHDGERLRIEPLPMGATLRDAREAFKTYFAERFELGGADFDDFLQRRLPALQDDFVATALHLTAGDWDPFIVDEYLQWLMDRFTLAENPRPTFLFFFIVSLKNAHQPDKIRRDDLEVLQSVEKLVTQNAARATLISPLPPVPTDDLEEWLEKLGQVTQAEKNALLQALANKLDAEQAERLHREKLLDMEPIEDLQERIYRIHR